MKRILLIVGLAFGCSSVYAQIVQIGDGNSSQILSGTTTNPASNISVLQLYGNIAEGMQGPDVNAPGQELTITLRQRNIGAVSPTLYNFYRVMQAGSNNDIVGDQLGYNNKASVTQSEFTTNGQITTSQSGNNNGTIIRQTSGSAYTAITRQGPVIPVGAFDNPPTAGFLTNTIRNTITLDQVGQAGSADIVQAGSYSRFTGIQRGGTPFQPNTLTIRQDNLSAIDVDQDGVNNDIDIRQDGWQYARATQGAATVRNRIDIDQGANRLEDTKNTAIVAQSSGDSNIATVDQSASTARENHTRITQMGTRDGAGTNSEVDVLQTGNSGRVIVTQDILTNNSDVIIEQSNARLGEGSYVEVGQSGRTNEFNTNQDGSLHIIFGTQKGQDNFTGIDQTGQKNRADVTQNGSDNFIDIAQANEPSGGIGNRATAIQGAGTSDSNIDINQNFDEGDDNVATVEQTRGDENSATVDQYEQNTATVTQSGTKDIPSGTSSTVDIDQSQSTGGEATVTQANGTFGNAVLISQEEKNNTATVNQTAGRLNAALVFQTDDNNMATVNQAGSEYNPGGTASTVVISQDGTNGTATATQAAGTLGGTITIIQDEERNVATVNQTAGALNNASISQIDDDNTATINQAGTRDAISGDQSFVTINQSGTMSMATATQAAGTQGGTIDINQDQERNMATVNQTAGRLNDANVNQTESDNTATVNQAGSEYNPTGVASSVTIQQDGTFGQATATQAAGTLGGTINIEQDEERNIATVNQTAGRLNTALVSQTDDDNTATVNQSGTADAGSGDPSVVVVIQDGKSGNVDLTQSANGSTVLATQFGGNDNDQTITQAGRANLAITFQNGDQNMIDLTQSGQENTGNIIQSNLLNADDPANGPSMHEATLVQSGTINEAAIGQAGLGNTAALTQAGQENFASTVQYGSGNEATTNQTTTGRNNTVNITQGRVNGGAAGNLAAARATRDATNVVFAIATFTDAEVLQSEDNVATVNQTAGENQVVNLIQRGDMETATIDQSGSDNRNRTRQAGEMDVLNSTQTGSQGLVVVTQYGEESEMGNDATINQGGSNNTIDVGQIKFGNMAMVTQTQSASNNNLLPGSIVRQVGEDNDATITQSGNRGNVTVIQGTLDDGSGPLDFTAGALAGTGYDPAGNDAFRNTAEATQGGLDNATGIVQEGNDGMATTNQMGNDNTIGIRQLNVGAVRSTNLVAMATQETGVRNSLIDIQQSGNMNEATATQSGTGANNVINLTQRKDKNTATLTQDTGEDNVINVRQNPDNFGTTGGMVQITQTGGSGNEARLIQTGYENTLTLTQDGDRNILRLDGGTPFATQGGHNNSATLMQMGEDNIINFQQSGMMNTATITQSNLGGGI